MKVNSINTNSVNTTFGSVVTVNRIVYNGQEIYKKNGPMLVKGSDTDVYVRAIMKSLVKNLKMPVDTPVARQLQEFITDLYCPKYGKKAKSLILRDTLKEVNLLVGKDAMVEEEIGKTSLPGKSYRIKEAIEEMFSPKSGKFKGRINVYASSRDMVEADGKDLYELIAIDSIEKLKD